MGFDRRGFMKFMAGATAGILATPVPWKLLDDVSIWTQNWSWIPSLDYGADSYALAVSKTCPSCVPVKVRFSKKRPVRILPNEEHPLGGGVTAIAAGEIQMLYSEARVQAPLKRSKDNAFIPISWDEAANILLEKVAEAQSTAFISGDENSSVNEVLSALAGYLGNGSVFLMPSEGQAAAKAAELMGLSGQIGYDLEQSDCLVAIGANIMDTWGTVVRNRRRFSGGRPHPEKDGENTVSLAYAGPLQNNTAAVADLWLPIKPGTEIVLALGLANLLIGKGKYIQADDFSEFKALAQKYSLETTASVTGVSAESIEQLAQAMLKAEAPLVIIGSECGPGAGAVPIMAGVALNVLLGNLNRPGGLTVIPHAPAVLRGAEPREEIYKRDLAAWLHKGENLPELLVLYEANPAYALPAPKATKAALQSIPYKVAFSTTLDETAMLCDLVLPMPMGLERMDDICNPYGTGKGIYCVSPQVAEHVVFAPHSANIFLQLVKQLEKKTGKASQLQTGYYADLLKQKAQRMHANFDVLVKGQPVINENYAETYNLALRADVLKKAVANAEEQADLALVLYSKLNLGTPKTGIPPLNTKTLRADELSGNDMYVRMNSVTAKKYNLAQDDKVKLEANGEKITARLCLSEGLVPGTVAVCQGFGHTALDAFSRNKGANAMDLVAASTESETGLSVWSQAAVVVTKA